MDKEVTFGAIVKERRHLLGLTQAELGRRVGCAAITIRKIEADVLRPSVQIAEHLAVALNIPEAEHLAFIRLARAERDPSPLPTPQPIPEEIGQADLSGRAIRGFELAERIGAGGYGVVYRAVQSTVERDVAVKIILPKFADRPEFIRRFETEAQLVARLEHPHIVPLYDYWREPSAAYLIMRLLRGGSLETLLKEGPLAQERILAMMEQLCAGLQTAHRAGVIHRDLKPANILLDEEGNAYLADFGIAKHTRNGNGNRAGTTLEGTVIGSPAYISPEQILAEPVKPQTDIYSLGILLYELLTGQKPFKGPTPVAYIQQHLNEALPLLAAAQQPPLPQTSKVFETFEVSAGQALPTALDIVIGRATAKALRDRYPDVPTLLADLRRALRPGSTAADLAESQTADTTPLHVAAMLELPDLENPYKGLRPFTEADAADFFGRDTLIQDLLARLAETTDLSRFLAVVGPSGSGKSSVVRAGLLPVLRQGGLPGSEQWFIAEMLPGRHPFEELAAALLRVAVSPPQDLLAHLRQDERGILRAVRRILPADEGIDLVLVIDQFEELFTLVETETTRAHFLNSLVTAVLDPDSRLRLVITLRADFTGQPLRYVDFGELVRQRTEFVLPLTPDELEAAIVGPTERAGLGLETGLTQAIIREIGDQPGMLPLLQYALTELFERRDGRLLTQAAYQESGGVLGALARRADELYTELDDAGRATARQLFSRLVTLGEGVEDTRRRVLRSELASLAANHRPPTTANGSGAEEQGREDDISNIENQKSKIENVIDTFGHYRLLTFDRDPVTRGPTVEVAHEALIREWERLRHWLNESRADIRLQRLLAAAAAEWLGAERDPGYLLRGSRLDQFEGWAASTDVALTKNEQAYLENSLAARQARRAEEEARQQREVRLEQRSRNFLRGLVVVFAVAAIISAGLGLYALRQQQIAQDNAAEAQNVALVAGSQAALADADTDTALALAWQAVTLNPDSAVAQTQLSEAAYSPGTVRRFVGHTDGVNNFAISPDERTMLSASRDGTLILWDIATGEPLKQFEYGTTIYAVALSPDGRNAISGGQDTTAVLWDVETGDLIRRFTEYENEIHEIAISPDGRNILAGGIGDDSSIIQWDIETGQVIRRFEGHEGGIVHIDFVPDRSAFLSASTDGVLILWDFETGDIIQQMNVHDQNLDVPIGSLLAAAVSYDGLRAASATGNFGVMLWDLSTGELIGSYEIPSGAAWITFHPDNNGKVLVGAIDQALVTLDLQTGQTSDTPTGHDNDLGDIEIMSNGRYAVTSSQDKTLRLRELDRGHVIRHFAAPNGFQLGADLSPDGRTALSASEDGSVTLWDVETGEMIRRFTDDQPVQAVTYSPDGQTALIGAGYRLAQKVEPGHVILWDLETGEEIRRFEGQPYAVYDVGFSPDGKRAVSSGNGAMAILWDVETGQEIHRLDDYFVDGSFPAESFWAVGFSPDGSTILVGYSKGPIILWDVETGEEIGQLLGHEAPITGITFSADGQRVVSGGWDGQAILWDMQTKSIIRRFTNFAGAVGHVDFTPDERLMLGGSADGTNSLWDVETGEVIRRYGNGFGNRLIFNADGSQALVGITTGPLELWRMDTTLDELLEWTKANRYIPELTCNQRELYRIEPLCEPEE